MKTQDLDIVYFVKAFPSGDLRYSIRSVAKNLEFHMLYIYGGKRADTKPDVYYEFRNQEGATKWDKVRNMYKRVCLNDNISEDFIMFHDDFFIMQPINKLEYEYRFSLDEHIGRLREKYANNLSDYSKLLINAKKLLERENKTTYSYELHKPFIFNRKKLLNILELFPRAHCIRTIYANYYELGGKQAHDVKLYGGRPAFDYKKEPMLSTNNIVSAGNNEYWDYIKLQFKEKCRFEI